LGQELVRESEFEVPRHEIKIEVKRNDHWVRVDEADLSS